MDLVEISGAGGGRILAESAEMSCRTDLGLVCQDGHGDLGGPRGDCQRGGWTDLG